RDSMRAIASASAGAPTALPCCIPTWPSGLERLFYNLGSGTRSVKTAKNPMIPRAYDAGDRRQISSSRTVDIDLLEG
ncbi:MAG: hypothetical protein M3R54_03340, partial [Chloroflexota bacterium]|nr:hypothetical protein [Chloroflexota bacterium]